MPERGRRCTVACGAITAAPTARPPGPTTALTARLPGPAGPVLRGRLRRLLLPPTAVPGAKSIYQRSRPLRCFKRAAGCSATPNPASCSGHRLGMHTPPSWVLQAAACTRRCHSPHGTITRCGLRLACTPSGTSSMACRSSSTCAKAGGAPLRSVPALQARPMGQPTRLTASECCHLQHGLRCCRAAAKTAT